MPTGPRTDGAKEEESVTCNGKAKQEKRQNKPSRLVCVEEKDMENGGTKNKTRQEEAKEWDLFPKCHDNFFFFFFLTRYRS